MCIFAPYNIENVLIDGYDVVVNKPKTAPYRAPGATNAAFGSETVIDELAEKLNIDALEFRIMNGAKEGVKRADGPVFPRIGFIESVEAAKTASALHLAQRKEAPRTRCCIRLLVQHRPGIQRHHQRQSRWHD